LVWTTWDDELNKNILKTKGFRNYVNMKNEDILAKTVSIGKPEKFKNRYWEIARDLSHMGTKAHMFYTQLFLDGWRSKYEKVV
jgi:hypothetical protein